MGDDIETGRTLGVQLLSCTTLVERKTKQTAIDDRPEPITLAKTELLYPQNRGA